MASWLCLEDASGRRVEAHLQHRGRARCWAGSQRSGRRASPGAAGLQPGQRQRTERQPAMRMRNHLTCMRAQVECIRSARRCGNGWYRNSKFELQNKQGSEKASEYKPGTCTPAVPHLVILPTVGPPAARLLPRGCCPAAAALQDVRPPHRQRAAPCRCPGRLLRPPTPPRHAREKWRGLAGSEARSSILAARFFYDMSACVCDLQPRTEGVAVAMQMH